MFQQSDAIRDFVFPIGTADQRADGIHIKNFLGSAFLIGNRGFALTAAHVILGSKNERLVGIFCPSAGGWFGYEVVARETHLSEDVAVIQLDGGPWKSFFRLSNSVEHASCRYRLFGYPEDAAYELVQQGRAVLRPDLIYNEGYIRRRISNEVPQLRGRSFFELSEIAGQGCSGAPIAKLSAPVWDVIGVYVGERINDRATSVSYAVREDAFRSWVPACMGVSVLDESRNVSV
jgi:trypsin-like peptidase